MRGLAILLLVACGDATTPREAVSVHVTAGLSAVAGARVWFHDSEMRLVLEIATDVDGRASAYIDDGYVTVLDPFTTVVEEPFTHRLYTIGGAKPGDELVLHTSTGISTKSAMQLVVPPYPQATQYFVYTSCHSEQLSPVPTAFVGCPATTSFVISAEDISGTMLATMVRDDVTIVDGATLDLAEAWVPTTRLDLVYANLPTGVTSVATRRTLFDGTPLPSGGIIPAALPNGYAVGLIGTDIGSRPYVLHSEFLHKVSGAIHFVMDWGPTPVTSYDGAIDLLSPPVAPPSVAPNMVAWDLPDDRDAIDSIVECTRDGLAWNWRVIAPFARDGVRLPPLPGDDGKYSLVDECYPPLVDFIRVTGGYDAVRERMLSEDPQALVTGDAGRAVIQRSHP